MTLGPLMLDLEGTTLTAADSELLRHPNVGGVILFARNFADADQLMALVDSIHRLREPHLLVAVDQEGGRVQRLRAGFTRLPAMARLGNLFDRDAANAETVAGQLGWLLAAELRAVGIDLSFAPVLDLRRGISEVIGDRALHPDPEAVACLAGGLINGMRQAGMAAVGKHFPGHGSVPADSHIDLPRDEREAEDILQLDGRPFERLAHAGLPGLMPAHVVYPRVDDRPAGFSATWIETILRQRFGFTGAVFSDDLTMGAVTAATPAERARAALAAGCDMILVCNDRAAAETVADCIGQEPRPVAQARLIRMHGRGGGEGLDRLRRSRQWRTARAAVDALAASSGPEAVG